MFGLALLSDDTDKKVHVEPLLKLLQKFGVKLPRKLTPSRVAQIERDLIKLRDMLDFLGKHASLFDESTAVWEEVDGKPLLVQLNGVVGAHNDDNRSGSGAILLPNGDPRWSAITNSKTFQDDWQKLALQLFKDAPQGKPSKNAANDLLKTWGMKVFTADGGGRGTNGTKGNRYLNRAELYFGLRNRLRSELEKHNASQYIEKYKGTIKGIADAARIGQDPSQLIFELKSIIPLASSAIKSYSDSRSAMRVAAEAALKKSQEKNNQDTPVKKLNIFDLFGSNKKPERVGVAPLDQFQIDQKSRQISSILLGINTDLINLESRVQTYKSFGGASPDFSDIAYKINQASKLIRELGKNANRSDVSQLNQFRNKILSLNNVVSSYTPIGGGSNVGVNSAPQNPYNYYPSSGGEMGPFPQTQPPPRPNYDIAGIGDLGADFSDVSSMLFKLTAAGVVGYAIAKRKPLIGILGGALAVAAFGEHIFGGSLKVQAAPQNAPQAPRIPVYRPVVYFPPPQRPVIQTLGDCDQTHDDY